MKKIVKKFNFMFRPSGESAFRMRQAGDRMSHMSYNWQVRCPSPHAMSPLNEQTLGKIFGSLHHFASHSPEAVTKKYHAAEVRFRNQHLPHGNSIRFLNKFTAHRWL